MPTQPLSNGAVSARRVGNALVRDDDYIDLVDQALVQLTLFPGLILLQNKGYAHDK